MHTLKKIYFLTTTSWYTTVWMHHFDADLVYREKDWRQLHKDATSYINQIPEVTFQKTTAVRPPTTHLEDHPD